MNKLTSPGSQRRFSFQQDKAKLRHSHAWVHLLMLMTTAMVAASFPVGAAITHALPPEFLMLIRFILAALLFAPFVFFKYGWQLPAPKRLLAYALLSLPLVAFFWCMFESLRYTSALNTAALYTLVPAITAVFSLLVMRERAGRWRSLGLLIGTFGALWLVFRGDWQAFQQLQFNHGDLIFMVGCVCMGLYNPMIKRLYQGEPMAQMTFWVIVLGSVWLLLLCLMSSQVVSWQAIDASVLLGVLYLALFTTLGSFFLLQFATVRIGPTKVAAYSFLTPLFVLLMVVFSGTERMTLSLVPGSVLVLLAMYLIQRDNGSGDMSGK